MGERACFVVAPALIALVSGCATVDVMTSIDAPAERPAAASASESGGSAGTDLPELTRAHSHSAHFSARRPAAIGKGLVLPKSKVVVCGILGGFAGGDLTCCLVRDARDAPWESLVIDLNGNKDLTDDAVFALPAPGAERRVTISRDGTDHSFVLGFKQPNERVASISLAPTAGRTGAATVGGRAIPWVVADCNLSGKLDAGDTAHFDPDGDGRLSGQLDFETVRLRPKAAVCLGGEWYTLAPDSAGGMLEVAAYRGRMHTLTLDCSRFPGGVKSLRELHITYADGSRVAFRDIDAAAGVELPAGTVRYAWGRLPTSPRPVMFTVRDLKLDKDVVLALGKPEARLSVRQTDGNIHVSHWIGAAGDVRYHLARSRPGPLVVLFRADAVMMPIARGNMIYGSERRRQGDSEGDEPGRLRLRSAEGGRDDHDWEVAVRRRFLMLYSEHPKPL